MQRGGKAIRASVLQAQSKSTNSYFLQLATSKPRAFKTLPENYLKVVLVFYSFFIFCLLNKETVTNSASSFK